LSPQIVRDSIDRSLKRLGTDYVDVYALHDPMIEDLDDPQVLRALEDVASAGKARVIGVAGSLAAAIRVRALGPPFRFVQLASPAFSTTLDELGRAPGAGPAPMTSIHSVLSSGDWPAQLTERAGSRERLQRLLAQHGYTMPLDAAVRALLIDDALDRNKDGLVLASMLSADHAQQNAARLAVGPTAARAVMGALDRMGVRP
jgi:aryl-alcohol dehydrogenase-like predicted oxidoreductase